MLDAPPGIGVGEGVGTGEGAGTPLARGVPGVAAKVGGGSVGAGGDGVAVVLASHALSRSATVPSVTSQRMPRPPASVAPRVTR